MKNTFLFFFTIYFVLFFCWGAHAQIITTIAGTGAAGYAGDNGPATDAELNAPYSTLIDTIGNMYIADAYNSCIRKIDRFGIITTVAGTGVHGYNGDNIPATAAQLNYPTYIALDAAGNLYISDAFNSRVRKITAGIITTIAGNGSYGFSGDGGPATAAEIYVPRGIAFDHAGNLYVSDEYNNCIRRVDVSGNITRFAGSGTPGFSGNNGPATAADINSPFGLCVDKNDNVYFTDQPNSCVWKVSAAGIISLVAGTRTAGYNGEGVATNAELSTPTGVAVDASYNVYIADGYNERIRMVNPAGIISTIAGTGHWAYDGDGPALSVNIDPTCVSLDQLGNIYISDFSNNRIRYMLNPLAAPVIAITSKDVAIYPNPSDGGLFIITIPSANNGQALLTITDVSGKAVTETIIKTNEQSAFKVSAPPGVYFAFIDHQLCKELVVR